MSHVIKIKRSEVANTVPTAGDLATHELAMNTADRKIYTKDSNGDIIVIGEQNQAGFATTDDLIAFSIALG